MGKQAKEVKLQEMGILVWVFVNLRGTTGIAGRGRHREEIGEHAV
jgi:hypothetical protein